MQSETDCTMDLSFFAKIQVFEMFEYYAFRWMELRFIKWKKALTKIRCWW
jgi:hypothetical protein